MKSAEKTILAICLGHPTDCELVFSTVTPDYFEDHVAQAVYAAAKKAFDDGYVCDINAVYDNLAERNATVPREQLLEFVLDCPEAPNTNSYILKLQNEYKIRQIALLGKKLSSVKTRDNPDSVLQGVESFIDALKQEVDSRTGGEPIVELKKPFYEYVGQAALRKEGELIGYGTGLRELDYITTGFQPDQLITLGARPAMGKTAMALQIAHHVASNHGPVLFLSLEMNKNDLMRRLVALLAKIPYRDLLFGSLSEIQLFNLSKANSLMNVPLVIDDEPLTSIPLLSAKIKTFQSKFGKPALIVVDYLQLIQGSGQRNSRTEDISAISRGLVMVSKIYGAPVLALSQLNRNLESRPDKRPTMSDLRESGSIEQDSHTVIFLYRDEVYNKASPDQGIAEAIVAKNRSGETGTARLAFMSQFPAFENIASTL